jgi:hypothetical protein
MRKKDAKLIHNHCKIEGGVSIQVPLQQIVFCSNSIVPDQPQPNFDFQGGFSLPYMSE